jgi:hypothetical protein
VTGSLDDLDRSFPSIAQWLPALIASIATIGDDVSQPRVAADDLGQHERFAIAVSHVSGVGSLADWLALRA